MGCLPFAVTDIHVVVAGGAAPVDAGKTFAIGIGAELPEVFAHATLATAMPPGNHGVGDPLCLDHAVRHEHSALAGAVQQVAAGCLLDDLADRCHAGQGLPYLRRSETRPAMTSRTVMPSARAGKVSAMRCSSTGSASAWISSIDGARRPS